MFFVVHTTKSPVKNCCSYLDVLLYNENNYISDRYLLITYLGKQIIFY